jgi:hypothetical protein
MLAYSLCAGDLSPNPPFPREIPYDVTSCSLKYISKINVRWGPRDW